MQLEKRLEKIEKQLEAVSSSRFQYADVHFGGSASTEIDLLELWKVLWSGKWSIIGITLAFAFLSVFYALSLPNIYKSEALLASAGESSGGGIASIAGSLGGLASLAGVNLGSGSDDKTTVAIEVLKSREFISKFIDKHSLLVPLMAAKGWNRVEDRLIFDKDIYDKSSQRWMREVEPPKKPEPSAQEAYRAFIELFSVSKDKETGFVTIAVEHFSPSIAKLWVDLIIKDINAEMKFREVDEANKSIQYLSEQLGKTSVADMKAVFYELIEEQTKTVMFAEVRDEYVFKTIDSAIVPEEKVRPKKALICVLGTMVGGFIGVFFTFVRHLLNKERE